MCVVIEMLSICTKSELVGHWFIIVCGFVHLFVSLRTLVISY